MVDNLSQVTKMSQSVDRGLCKKKIVTNRPSVTISGRYAQKKL